MEPNKTIRVLFVCAGNICRSPMAEVIFRNLVEEAGLADQIDVESAGTERWHVGEPPHQGTLAVLNKHSLAAGKKRARQFNRSDIRAFDYVVAMDAENAAEIESMVGRIPHPIPRLLEFASESSLLDVPDPYYTGNFDVVYQLVLNGCRGLLALICREEGL